MSEPIPTRESLAGFIASEPTLSATRTDQARWYARIGVEHWSRQADGTFTELAPTYHDLAVYGPLAERLEGRFRKGDTFVAHGTTRTYPRHAGADGTTQEFVARRIGHDIARTRYTVHRSPAGNHPAGRVTTARAADQDTIQDPVSGSRPRAVPDTPAEPSTVPSAAGTVRRLVPRRTLTGAEPS